MSIFNTAIQTLSEVAIQESGVKQPQTADNTLLEDFGEMLDNMPSLTEEEMRFDVRMVPVKESRKYDKYLIEMEDLSRYMITNRISSVKDAIGNILECNGLDGQFMNVALVIDEASIINEIDDLGLNISGQYPAPQPGLGETIYGRPDAMKYIRRIANTKELLDTLYNTYGIPFIKKNYTQVGLLKEESDISSDNKEDVQLKTKPNDEVLHEKDTKDQPSANFTNGAGDLNETSLSQYRAALYANQEHPGTYTFSPPTKEGQTNIVSNGSNISSSASPQSIANPTTNTSSSPSKPAAASNTGTTPSSSSASNSTGNTNTTSSSRGNIKDRISNILSAWHKNPFPMTSNTGTTSSTTNTGTSTSSGTQVSPTNTNPTTSSGKSTTTNTGSSETNTPTAPAPSTVSSTSSSSSLKPASSIPEYNKINPDDSNIVKQAKLDAQKKQGYETEATSESSYIQYLRDVAAGKYDYQL